MLMIAYLWWSWPGHAGCLCVLICHHRDLAKQYEPLLAHALTHQLWVSHNMFWWTKLDLNITQPFIMNHTRHYVHNMFLFNTLNAHENVDNIISNLYLLRSHGYDYLYLDKDCIWPIWSAWHTVSPVFPIISFFPHSRSTLGQSSNLVSTIVALRWVIVLLSPPLYLQVANPIVTECQHVDHSLGPHIQHIGARLLVQCYVVLWFREVKPRGLCGSHKLKLEWHN